MIYFLIRKDPNEERTMTVVDTPTKEQISSNRHNYVTKLECVHSSCPASAEIRDASEPLNECRYLV